MVNLEKEIQFIKGVGPNRATLLNKLGIFNLKDLITYFPREYEDRGKIKTISELENGEESLISAYPAGRINEIKIRKNLTLYKLIVRDETGSCEVTWYNQSYLKNVFRIDTRYKFFGRVARNFNKISMQSPVYETEDSNKNTGKIIPIYPLTYNLSQNTIRHIIENGLKEVDGKLEETLPKYLLEKYNLYDYNTAIKQIHFPENFGNFNLARKRLVFEELFSMQLALLSLKNKYEIKKSGISFSKQAKMIDIIEISKSPYKINAKVLGIGVAVITKTSGLFPFSVIVLLCLTPNLCCSSVTTKPKFLKITFSSKIACVPIKISIFPSANLFKISSFFFLVIPLIKSSHFIPELVKISLKVSKC